MNNKEKIQNAFNCFYNYNEDTQKIRNEFFENQEFYLKLFDSWSFGRRIQPENKEEVFHELDAFFGI